MLTFSEALDVTRIYSVACVLPDGLPLSRIHQHERFSKLDKTSVLVNADMGLGKVQTFYQAICA